MEGRWIGLDNDVRNSFNKPAIMEALADILVCAVPIWVAVMLGLLIGWSWRPRWNGLVLFGLRLKLRFIWTAPMGFGARRFWFLFTALSAFSVCRQLLFSFRSKSRKEEEESSKELEDSAASLALMVIAAVSKESEYLVASCRGDIKEACHGNFRWGIK